MIVYLLCKQLYKNDLSGRGAELAGDRWNSKGIAVLYTSESRALCTTEIAVHIPLGILPNGYCLITIIIPDNIAIKELKPSVLPKDQQTTPFNKKNTRNWQSFRK